MIEFNVEVRAPSFPVSAGRDRADANSFRRLRRGGAADVLECVVINIRNEIARIRASYVTPEVDAVVSYVFKDVVFKSEIAVVRAIFQADRVAIAAREDVAFESDVVNADHENMGVAYV